MRAQRQALEEDSLKKRLALHEKNAREITDKMREIQETAGLEAEAMRARYEERIGEIIVERSELKDKLLGLEKQVFTL